MVESFNNHLWIIIWPLTAELLPSLLSSLITNSLTMFWKYYLLQWGKRAHPTSSRNENTHLITHLIHTMFQWLQKLANEAPYWCGYRLGKLLIFWGCYQLQVMFLFSRSDLSKECKRYEKDWKIPRSHCNHELKATAVICTRLALSHGWEMVLGVCASLMNCGLLNGLMDSSKLMATQGTLFKLCLSKNKINTHEYGKRICKRKRVGKGGRVIRRDRGMCEVK